MKGEVGNEFYDPQVGLKRILLSICLQDIRNGMGLGMSNIDKEEDRNSRRLEAAYYILTDDFEEDMEAVGRRHLVKDARILVVNSMVQYPQGKEVEAARYKREPQELVEYEAFKHLLELEDDDVFEAFRVEVVDAIPA